MRCSALRGTFCSLITLATPRQDWTGSNPSRREGGGCGFTLSRSHSCCAVRLVYIQISPGHIWTTLYIDTKRSQFRNCWVISVYQVTIHEKSSKYPPPESTHVWARLIMDCRTLSKDQWRCCALPRTLFEASYWHELFPAFGVEDSFPKFVEAF